MVSHTENSIIFTVRQSSIAIALFAGAMCWSHVVNGQTSPAAPSGQSPAPAAPTVASATGSTPAAQPAATKGAAEGAPAGSPTSGPNVEATISARSSLCKRYIDVLSGRAQDNKLLESAEAQQLVHAVPDLVTCAAVKNDSQALCDLLSPVSSGARRSSSEAMDCIRSESMFHEARTYPKGRSFMFTEFDRKECEGPFCDALQDAMRTGDEKKCAATGAFQSYCRAYLRLDKSLCHIEGKVPKQRHENDNTQSVDDGCKQMIEGRAFLARGLEALAKSGSPRERELAKAALGKADACSSFAQAAMDACTGKAPVSPPPAGTPASTTPVPSPASAPERSS